MVPVITKDQKPLMPCSEKRARQMIASGKATPFWKKGIFCVRLNVEPSARNLQPVVVGIDPGSKKEGYTVKSTHHTYLNLQADAVTWVKERVELRKSMRKARRFRGTPCRSPRSNRSRQGLPPSTKARWQWKLRMCRWLSRIFPISRFVVEDIKAKTKGQRRWDTLFSPLEAGKRWFYDELGRIAPVETRRGWETKQIRDALGLKKSKNKMAENFSAHCVDSWVLANAIVGGHTKPDHERMLLVIPLKFHRRQLHKLQPAENGVVYVGGTSRNRISVHEVATGRRVLQCAKPSDCVFLTYNAWRTSSPKGTVTRE